MKKQSYEKKLNILYAIILFLYPLRHIFVGAEWWDTGYNYANFTYMDRMDPMWFFSTFLGNVTGHFFTKLPGGGTMVGLNVYTGLLVSALALAGYFFFTRKIQIPATITFWGEMLAISLCWCPTALLYNYLTYLLLTGGCIALYYGLEQEGKGDRALFLAGIFLGVNVFTRFSNLAQMAFILAVWAMAVIRKQKFARTMIQTLWCIAGYVAAVGVVFGIIALIYGGGAYVDAVTRLLSMPSEATDYTIRSMVEYQLRNFLQNFIWMSYLAGFTVLGILVYSVMPKVLVPIMKVGYIVCVFGGFYFLRMRNMFNMKYSTKLSAFQWGVMLLSATMILGVVLIFGKKHSQRDKLLAGLGMLIIVITPLGSNNHLYSSINNLFLVAPFTLWMLVRFLKWLPSVLPFKVPDKAQADQEISGKWKVCTYPIKAMMACILLAVTFQSLGFGWGYVFSEGDGGENLHTAITGNAVLKGMKTDPGRAKVLEELYDYVSEQELSGRDLIVYGNIPSLPYYLQMPFAITPWPDLRSYNYEIMKTDLDKVAADGSRPVLLLEKIPAAYLSQGEKGLTELGLAENVIERTVSDRKLELLRDWISGYGYEICFENEKFVMYRIMNP